MSKNKKPTLDLRQYLNDDNTIKDINSGKYINQNGKIGYVTKKDGKSIFIQIGSYPLVDFNIIDNGIEKNQYELRFRGLPAFKGNFEGLKKQLTPNIITNKQRIAHDFLSDLIIKNPTKIKKQIDGGYGSLEDISDVNLNDNDINNIQKHIVDYMAYNFSDEMITAFRLLIMLPFHWILKTDVDVNDKHFIKGIALYGWKDCGKTFIVNFVLNMFKQEKIKFVGEEGYKTFAGFYGGLRQNVGIFLVDDCNSLLNKYPIDFNDIINGIPRHKISKQGTEGGGAITDDNYASTPVFTSNNKPPFNKSNLARLDVIHMTRTYNPKKKFLLSKGKNLLLKFGQLIAMSFKTNYEEIRKCNTPIEASNIILEFLPLNMKKILNADIKTVDNMQDLPINLIVKQNIEETINKELYYNTLSDYIHLFNWLLKYNSDTGLFQIDLNDFYSYLEEITHDTSRNFQEEVNGIIFKKSTMRVGKKTINTHSVSETDLLDWLGVGAEEGKSYPCIDKVQGKPVVYINKEQYIFF